MNTKQKTLKSAVSLSGVGLHTGAKVTVTINPADENFGYKFKRIDLDNQPIIKADVSNVVETTRSTTLEENGARISTIEHLLASLVGFNIDNALIEVDGPEIPILDGSSKLYIQEFEKVGLVEQNADVEYFVVTDAIKYIDKERKIEITALPHDDYKLTVLVDYNSKVLGSQYASIDSISEFSKEIASSRTFCFLHELEMLAKNGLVKGGDLDNAIVIVDREVKGEELASLAKLLNKPNLEIAKEGILNTLQLSHSNEPSRHKLLDVIGDLALVGVRIKGHIIANRPGHQSNVAFAKQIKELVVKNRKSKPVYKYNPNATPVYTVEQVMARLPHRYPFLLVDKVLEISQEHVVGVKNVTMNEPFFPGHFPGMPVMPGVLQIEALAQNGGILALNTVPDPENYLTLFLKIDSVRFIKPVVPGDTLILRCDLITPVRRGICQMKGLVIVGDKVVTEAEMMAQIVRKK